MSCINNKVYSKYSEYYKKHTKGYVILGPPGIGKTTFVKNQKGEKKNWIDQDDLFYDLGLDWKLNIGNNFKLNYLKADRLSEESKLLGFRIIGSLFWEYLADAIVIIPLELHKKYLEKRPDLSYEIILDIRNFLFQHAKKNNIPVFDNIIETTNYLENL